MGTRKVVENSGSLTLSIPKELVRLLAISKGDTIIVYQTDDGGILYRKREAERE
jgi:bifunctional DNA-binding transcriptional regulator/antitoxin component of YhaV-PrlF toxin-antitoxin module